MNDQAKTNGKMPLAFAGGIGIVGVLLGVLVSHLLTVQQSHKGFGPPSSTNKVPTHWKAIINRDSNDDSCTQFASPQSFGSVVSYAFPVLSAGDTIMWHGQVDGKPVPKVHIEFPPVANPFTGRYKYDQDVDSDPVRTTAGYGDYPFAPATDKKVTVDDKPCSSFTDPGIHVDQ